MAAEKVQLTRLGFTRGEPPPSTQFGCSGGDFFPARARPLAPGGQGAGGLGLRPRPMQPAPQNIPGLLRDTLDLAQPTNRLRGVTMFPGRAEPDRLRRLQFTYFLETMAVE